MATKRMHPRFRVPNLGAKHRKKVKDRWRSQRGDDNKKKLKKSGYGKMPSIGYKNTDAVRFQRAGGGREVLVHNEGEMAGLISAVKQRSEAALMARLAHDLSRRKKAALTKLAESNGIEVVNRVLK